jgi:high-affinity nickel permease
MFGLDDWIAHLSSGATLLAVAGVAVLLGLRHATDPDHLSAVGAIVATRPGSGARGALAIGLGWGAGHATSLVALGLPVVLFARHLPEAAGSAAEAAAGLLIIGLAVRLLIRWRRGLLHAHAHEHDGARRHAHLHGHAPDGRGRHAERRVRTPLGAYAIGLVHGIGGSAGVAVLLLAAIPGRALAITALVLFAAFTAVSMALCTGLAGVLLGTQRVRAAFPRIAPAMGAATLAFGAWYLAGALTLAPYPF